MDIQHYSSTNSDSNPNTNNNNTNNNSYHQLSTQQHQQLQQYQQYQQQQQYNQQQINYHPHHLSNQNNHHFTSDGQLDLSSIHRNNLHHQNNSSNFNNQNDHDQYEDSDEYVEEYLSNTDGDDESESDGHSSPHPSNTMTIGNGTMYPMVPMQPQYVQQHVVQQQAPYTVVYYPMSPPTQAVYYAQPVSPQQQQQQPQQYYYSSHPQPVVPVQVQVQVPFTQPVNRGLYNTNSPQQQQVQYVQQQQQQYCHAQPQHAPTSINSPPSTPSTPLLGVQSDGESHSQSQPVPVQSMSLVGGGVVQPIQPSPTSTKKRTRSIGNDPIISQSLGEVVVVRPSSSSSTPIQPSPTSTTMPSPRTPMMTPSNSDQLTLQIKSFVQQQQQPSSSRSSLSHVVPPSSSPPTSPINDHHHQHHQSNHLTLHLNMSDNQRSAYRNLLRINIPRSDPKKPESEQLAVLNELYVMLMDCSNHPDSSLTNSIQSFEGSTKLIALEKIIIECRLSTSQSQIIILSSSLESLKIIKLFCQSKSIEIKDDKQKKSKKGARSKKGKESLLIPSIIITTFNQYQQQCRDKDNGVCGDILIEFDHYLQSQGGPSSNDHLQHATLSFTLISNDSVEEWVYLNSNKSGASGEHQQQRSTFDMMREMMRHCILRLSSSSTLGQRSITNSPSTSTPALVSPRTPISSSPSYSSPSLVFGQHNGSVSSSVSSGGSSNGHSHQQSPLSSSLSTPVSSSPSTSSPSLRLHIEDTIANQPANYDPWKKSVGKVGQLNLSLLSSSSGGSQSPVGSQHDCSSSSPVALPNDKKRKSSKRHKHLIDRKCFTCKHEEDDKGRTSIVQCRSCPKIYHRSCADLKHTPRSWKCPRHTCSSCRKLSSESGGSFFICKDCPSSFCITCLPDDVHILEKHEYHEIKPSQLYQQQQQSQSDTIDQDNNNNNSPSISSSSLSSQSSQQSSSSNQLITKKSKTRPTVYIVCGKCRVVVAGSSPSIPLSSAPLPFSNSSSSTSNTQLGNTSPPTSPPSPSLRIDE